MEKIQIQCPACAGSGLYQGFAERKGEAVVCISCEGSGATTISYTPYAGRKQEHNVNVVRVSRGSFIGTGVGGVDGTEMTYEEFQQEVPEAPHEY